MTLYEDWNPKNNSLSKIYPVKFKFDTKTISIDPLAPAQSQITAIVVQDVARNIWYTWQNGTWSNAGGGGNNAPPGQSPQVTVGAGNLYVAFSITNVGGGSANFALVIWNGLVILKNVTVPLAPGGTGGIEVTTDMPNGQVTLQLTSNP